MLWQPLHVTHLTSALLWGELSLAEAHLEQVLCMAETMLLPQSAQAMTHGKHPGELAMLLTGLRGHFMEGIDGASQ